MIIAVPDVKLSWFSVNGSHQNKYQAQSVWWLFECTTCGRGARDVPTRCSTAAGALGQGEHHEARYQCHDGQLALFPAVAV